MAFITLTYHSWDVIFHVAAPIKKLKLIHLLMVGQFVCSQGLVLRTMSNSAVVMGPGLKDEAAIVV